MIDINRHYSRIVLTVLALWVVMIFSFSSQPHDEQRVQPILKKVISNEALRTILPDIRFQYGEVAMDAKEKPYAFVEFFLRKLGHVLMYGILSVMVCMALRKFSQPLPRTILIAIGVLIVVSSLDEWNQMHHAGRNGTWRDVFLDVGAGVVGMSLFLTMTFIRYKYILKRSTK